MEVHFALDSPKIAILAGNGREREATFLVGFQLGTPQRQGFVQFPCGLAIVNRDSDLSLPILPASLRGATRQCIQTFSVRGHGHRRCRKSITGTRRIIWRAACVQALCCRGPSGHRHALLVGAGHAVNLSRDGLSCVARIILPPKAEKAGRDCHAWLPLDLQLYRHKESTNYD